MTYTSAVLIKAYLGPLGTGDDALLDELGDRAQKIVETITSAHYVTIPRNKTPYFGVKLLASANKEWDYQDDPEMGITVVANFRYSVTPPEDVVQATTRLAAFLYRQKDSNADLDRR